MALIFVVLPNLDQQPVVILQQLVYLGVDVSLPEIRSLFIFVDHLTAVGDRKARTGFPRHREKDTSIIRREKFKIEVQGHVLEHIFLESTFHIQLGSFWIFIVRVIVLSFMNLAS